MCKEADRHALEHVSRQIQCQVELLAAPFPLGENLHRRLIPLALERFLRGPQNPGQFLVRAGRHRQLEESDEHRVPDMAPVRFHALAYVVIVGGRLGYRLAEGAQALGVEVLHRSAHDGEL